MLDACQIVTSLSLHSKDLKEHEQTILWGADIFVNGIAPTGAGNLKTSIPQSNDMTVIIISSHDNPSIG